ncbi:MAG: thioesterase domain-containing protein, partial [Microcystis panniformis]
ALQYKASLLVPYYMMAIANHQAGLNSTPFAYEKEIENSIPAMAKSLLADVLATAGGKEITIIGYSLGGLVAFELARLLEKEDRSVRLMIMDNSVEKNEKVTDIESLQEFFEVELVKAGIKLEPAAFGMISELYTKYLKRIRPYKVSGVVRSPVLAIEAVNKHHHTDMMRWAKHTAQFDGVEYVPSEHTALLEHLDLLTPILTKWLDEK